MYTKTSMYVIPRRHRSMIYRRLVHYDLCVFYQSSGKTRQQRQNGSNNDVRNEQTGARR